MLIVLAELPLNVNKSFPSVVPPLNLIAID
jgi:hypothetical protein